MKFQTHKENLQVHKHCKISLNMLKGFGLSRKATENTCVDFFQDAY